MKNDCLKHIPKLLFAVVLTAFTIHGAAQGPPNVRRVLSQITSILDRYKKGYKWDGKKERFAGADSTYRVVAHMDTVAIIRLMHFLADTTETTILSTCDGGRLTFGLLAFLLIHDIEPVPYFLVTQMQFDTLFDCGLLPDGILTYIKNNQVTFEKQYRAYCNSEERQRYLREQRKERKATIKTKRIPSKKTKERTQTKR